VVVISEVVTSVFFEFICSVVHHILVVTVVVAYVDHKYIDNLYGNKKHVLLFVNGNITPHVQRLATAKSSNAELQLLAHFVSYYTLFKTNTSCNPPRG